jgi:YYY domain-containing protein
MQTEPSPEIIQPKVSRRSERMITLLLLLVLALGMYLRFTGVNWDEFRHLHPDERFLTMVEAAVSPVKSLGDYFNTAVSTLNPNNVGYGFFVYGTLPIFIVRYIGEWLNKAGYDQIHLVGRQLSATADLLTVLMVYLIGARLYNKRVGLLAAAFAAFSVLPIQLSHYFTVDTFTNFFGFAAVYGAVIILTRVKKSSPTPVDESEDTTVNVLPTRLERWTRILTDVLPYLMFGVALGMAVASKINAVTLAALLPLVVVIKFLRMLPQERRRQLWPAILNLVLAGLVSLVVFRICQPYAFSGPGFFGIMLNPKWVATMRELYNQSSGDVDFPPALQWARRPVWFAWENMVKWGLGLPLGLLAWAAFLWMGWRTLMGEWHKHLMLWGWTAFYFTWQSLSWTSSMRYQMLVYPSLAIIAAWGVITLWDWGKSFNWGKLRFTPKAWRILAGVLGGGVLLATLLWAIAFIQIYVRPLTRNEASRWIYQNVPAPFNLKIDTAVGLYNQPLAYHSGATVTREQSYTVAFKPQTSGSLIDIQFPSVVDTLNNNASKSLLVAISTNDEPGNALATSLLSGDFPAGVDRPGKNYHFPMDSVVILNPDEIYLIKVSLLQGQGSISLLGPPVLTIMVGPKVVMQSLPAPVDTVEPGKPFSSVFTARASGELKAIDIPHIVDQSGSAERKTLALEVAAAGGSTDLLQADASVDGSFSLVGNGHGGEATFTFAQPLRVEKDSSYVLTLQVKEGSGAIAVYGSAPALESTWDDALPQPLDDYWPYDYYTGLYQGDLNFEMYWPDNADKLTRFQTTLDQADYLFISSNRQWGTTVRVPERYPLTTEYYRSLLGCPAGKDILWCYSVATPEMFTGQLGYDLVETAQSEPTLGPITINTQFAEEAFTVYDHPKVLIFKKGVDYKPEQVSAVLGAVDLTHVVNVTPRKAASSPPPTEMLPADQLLQQQAGGTWSDLFNRLDLQNRYPAVGVVLWYLGVGLLGLLAYPIVRIALPGLPDKGYPLARLAGMLILSYIVWLAGSFEIPYTRLTISLVVVGIAIVGGLLAYLQRAGLRQEWQVKRRYFLIVEAVALTFFIFFLLIRVGNPDLWHPYHGGEKPMDFSYLNAVIKSTTFPPYDPWFAGGSLNYYYYGFVIVGTVVKWLGIVPSVAYNLILPLLYSLVALGAFSLGWNIIHGSRKAVMVVDTEGNEPVKNPAGNGRDYLVSLAASVGVVLLGNLGTVRMIWQGFQRLAANGVDIDKVSVLTRWILSIQGAVKFIMGSRLPYGPGDWYWIPSRAIPREPITEFPMFTFLYADLHAHMIALPITVMVLAWVLAVVMGRGRWGEEDGRLGWVSAAFSFLLAGVTIGALRPTNFWDFPTYLVLGVLALVYTLWRYFKPPNRERWPGLPGWMWRVGVIAASAAVLVGLSFLLYEPFSRWFGQGYNSLDYWQGSRTPFWSYLTHWGLFLFIIVTWMGWETYHWMAATPMSALNKLRPYRNLIASLLFILLFVVVMLVVVLKVQIAWLILPLAAWAGVLILRPGMPDIKRVVLFLTGTALFLNLVVELFALHGDIGRMNMVFKFYFQCWTLFAISAAAGFAWMLEAVPAWSKGWRNGWMTGVMLLVAGAALFPILATMDKITNRMAPLAPHTLDGMTFMAYSEYNDEGKIYSLSDDYRMIIWMQEHILGSPVIVEGNTVEYRWGTRFTVYTGLPGVVGYNWHQRQQRALLPSEVVTDRVAAITDFYLTPDPQAAVDFLKKYNVSFILVGNLERADYPGKGLDKLEIYNGKLWQEVHREGDTVIYQVIK